VGDLVNRGPDSRSVLHFFRERLHARSVAGNHERKHVREARAGQAAGPPGAGGPPGRGSVRQGREQIGPEEYPAALQYMMSLPPFIALPEAIVVHAFWEPGLTLAEQDEEVLVGSDAAEAYLARWYPRPWYELYDGPLPLVCGHHDYLQDRQPLVIDDRVYMIDTGCVYGGRLTGLLLPEWRLLSVDSRGRYWGGDGQQQDQDADRR
jgi:hypothetical protein